MREFLEIYSSIAPGLLIIVAAFMRTSGVRLEALEFSVPVVALITLSVAAAISLLVEKKRSRS